MGAAGSIGGSGGTASGGKGLSVRSRDSCDNWNFSTSNPVIYAGGNYSRNDNYGLFYLNYTSLTNTNANHGGHLLRFCYPQLHLHG